MIKLSDYFGQSKVKKLILLEFLSRGFRVVNGVVYCGEIEISPVKIARALKVDRRAVIETAETISKDIYLSRVFSKLESKGFIGNAAKDLGFDSIVIKANASSKGIIAEVTKILANDGVVIRQLAADDPDLFLEPKLYLVINGKIPISTFSKIKKLKFADEIIIK